jgi:glycosyltransferase involved in cell wall biosynthesis
MRIAYVYVGGGLDRTVGITRKLADQISVWRARGHEVRLFIQAYTPDGASSAVLERAGIRVERFIDRRIDSAVSWGAMRQRLGTISRLVSAVEEWRPTLAYARFTMSYPPLVRMARQLPLALEINTDDVAEYRGQLPWYKYLYHRLTRGNLLRAATGLVYTTPELAGYPHLAVPRARSVVIPNGVNLDQPLPPRAAARARPRVLFLGEPGFPWHGTDKVLALARRCPDWDFDLVGPEAADLGQRPIPENVRPHGYLPAERYLGIAAEADVALGTLALHRKHMNEACPLKVREYLACGLPTVIAYRDVDFTHGAWFLLELPNTPDNVAAGLGEIRAFVQRVRGQRVPREAIAHLDFRRKEAARLDFFEQVLSNGRRP